MNEDKIIKEINEHLEKIGSKFRTEDGKVLCKFIGCNGGEIKFLRRVFNNANEMKDFVFALKVI